MPWVLQGDEDAGSIDVMRDYVKFLRGSFELSIGTKTALESILANMYESGVIFDVLDSLRKDERETFFSSFREDDGTQSGLEEHYVAFKAGKTTDKTAAALRDIETALSAANSADSRMLGAEDILDAWNESVIDEATTDARLKRLGYDVEDISIMKKVAGGPEGVLKKKREATYASAKEQQQAFAEKLNYDFYARMRGEDVGGLGGDPYKGTQKSSGKQQYNNNRYTTSFGQQQQPETVLDDFRTAFATRLKDIRGGLGVPEMQWAVDNMELFLMDYLGTQGQAARAGTATGTAATTPGAGAMGWLSNITAESVKTRFEGTKGTPSATRRTSEGTISARRVV